VYDPEQGDILRIQYIDYDQQFATFMANKVVEHIEERYQSFAMEKVTYKRQFLEARLEEMETQLKDAEKELNRFKREKGIVGVQTVKTETGSYVQELVYSRFIPPDERQVILNDFEELRSDVSHLQKLYNLLLEQYQAAKIEELDESKQFQVVESAIPMGQIRPDRNKIILIITGATFVLALLITFGLHYLERVKQDPEEAEKLEQIKTQFLGSKKYKN
jgi:uncharacterized protein involved in exopolysaccharide biosynthesis